MSRTARSGCWSGTRACRRWRSPVTTPCSAVSGRRPGRPATPSPHPSPPHTRSGSTRRSPREPRPAPAGRLRPPRERRGGPAAGRVGPLARPLQPPVRPPVVRPGARGDGPGRRGGQREHRQRDLRRLRARRGGRAGAALRAPGPPLGDPGGAAAVAPGRPWPVGGAVLAGPRLRVVRQHRPRPHRGDVPAGRLGQGRRRARRDRRRQLDPWQVLRPEDRVGVGGRGVTGLVLDLFCGVGVAVGLRALGLEEVGIDADPAVCATRRAVGLATVRGEVERYYRDTDRPSPVVRSNADRWKVRSSYGQPKDDPRNGGHEFDPHDRPAHTVTGKARDWTLRTGNHDRAFDRSVPRPPSERVPHLDGGSWFAQWAWERPAPTVVGTRRSGDGAIVGRQLPEGAGREVGGWRWRSNTQAHAAVRDLDPPASTIFAGGRVNDISWVRERPATTVQGAPRAPRPGHRDREGGEHQQDGAVRVTLEERAVLQGCDPALPFQGNKMQRAQQVGNAVPPPLAAAIVAALTGADRPTT